MKEKHQTKLPQSAPQHDRKKTTRRLKRVDGWIQFRALARALKKEGGKKMTEGLFLGSSKLQDKV